MEHDDLTDRLRALGDQPVPDTVHDAHLRRMASVVVTDPSRRFGRLAVAAAALVGFFAGSTGLAMAGALPDPAQDVAHDVLSTVSVDVPEGTRGSCVSGAARDKSLTPEEKELAKDACPKGGPPSGVGPDSGGDDPGKSGDAPGRSKHADDPCRGRPPWAGPGLTEAERASRKAETAGACPGRGTDDEVEDAEPSEGLGEAEAEAGGDDRAVDEATTTTTSTSTTTSTITTTTTTSTPTTSTSES